jgi:hypothetical protein
MMVKNELQKYANRMNTTILEMYRDGKLTGTRTYGEFIGRVLAVDTIARHILGIEIDTRFPWQWVDEDGNEIEPDYRYK